MMYCRGHKEDYNEWEHRYGAKGWSWDTNIEPIFRRLENASECDPTAICSSCHGMNGPIGISHKRPPSALAMAFVASAQVLMEEGGGDVSGGVEQGDYNCHCQPRTGGVVGLHQQTVRHGTRCDTSRAYIEPLELNSRNSERPNLFVLTGADCRSIVIDKDDTSNQDEKAFTASGVELVLSDPVISDTTKNGSTVVIVQCEKEIILSAGALASPQILLQSGIGPDGNILKLPEVGKNLQDHMVAYLHYSPKQQGRDIGSVNVMKAVGSLWTDLRNKIQLFLFRRGILSSSAYDASMFLSSDQNSRPYYDLQMSALCTPTDKGVFENNLGLDLDEFPFTSADLAPDAEGMVICHTLLHPKSRGKVELNKPTSRENNGITIHANYWTDAGNEDISRLAGLLRKGFQLTKHEPLRSLLEATPVLPRDLCQKYNLPPLPTIDQIPDAFWEEYIRRYATTLYHPVGTCRIGRATSNGVVDPRLRVFGVRNLRVADASIQPEIVSGNTNASCIVIGERAAEIIMEDHDLKSDPGHLSKLVARYEASKRRKRWILVLGGAAVASVGLASLTTIGALLAFNRNRGAYRVA